MEIWILFINISLKISKQSLHTMKLSETLKFGVHHNVRITNVFRKNAFRSQISKKTLPIVQFQPKVSPGLSHNTNAHEPIMNSTSAAHYHPNDYFIIGLMFAENFCHVRIYLSDMLMTCMSSKTSRPISALSNFYCKFTVKFNSNFLR
jgi:hypothetical protein